MAGKDQQRRLVAPAGPEIADPSGGQVLHRKAHGRQALGQQRLAAGVLGRHRGPGDQVCRQLQGL